LIILVGFLAVSFSSGAEEAKRTGTIVDFKGNVSVKFGAGGEVDPAQVEMTVNEGDMIITGKDSWAVLKLGGREKAEVSIEENAQLSIVELAEDEEGEGERTFLDLARGKIFISTDRPKKRLSAFDVKTPTSIISVKEDTKIDAGRTSFSVDVEQIE